MTLKVPFMGLIAQRSPLEGLLDHYACITRGMELIDDSIECYLGGGGLCREFKDLSKEVNDLEEQADKIKRSIRNHLPRGLFMPVDKTVFLNYTRSQDDILDKGQEALDWLLMRPVNIPERFQKDLLLLLAGVTETVTLLKPALEATIALVHGKQLDRGKTKDTYRALRAQHKNVWHQRSALVSTVYNSTMDFKDIYQILHFAECLFEMSHRAEGCADLLRAMIAR